MWLHFDRGNSAAEALYLSRGFAVEREDPAWRIWPKRQSLLSKQLTPMAPWPVSPVTDVTGSVRRSDGVFVWEQAADVSGQDAETS